MPWLHWSRSCTLHHIAVRVGAVRARPLQIYVQCWVIFLFEDEKTLGVCLYIELLGWL